MRGRINSVALFCRDGGTQIKACRFWPPTRNRSLSAHQSYVSRLKRPLYPSRSRYRDDVPAAQPARRCDSQSRAFRGNRRTYSFFANDAHRPPAIRESALPAVESLVPTKPELRRDTARTGAQLNLTWRPPRFLNPMTFRLSQLD